MSKPNTEPYSKGKYTNIYQDEKEKKLYLIAFNQARVNNPSVFANEIKEEWEVLLSHKGLAFMIDMSEIRQPVSVLAGVFHWAWELAKESGSSLVLCKPRKDMVKMLKLCGLDEILPIQPNLKAGRQAVLGGGAGKEGGLLRKLFGS